MVDNKNRELIDLLNMLSPEVPNKTEVVQKEPCTYHRRGHRFESCIVHHAYGLHKEKLPIIEILEILSLW